MGTRAALRTVIRYRNGVLQGKGASLLDGYMEDQATDRIYRLMIAQRMRHSRAVPIADERGKPVEHTPELLYRLFEEEMEKNYCPSRPRAGPRPKLFAKPAASARL